MPIVSLSDYGKIQSPVREDLRPVAHDLFSAWPWRESCGLGWSLQSHGSILNPALGKTTQLKRFTAATLSTSWANSKASSTSTSKSSLRSQLLQVCSCCDWVKRLIEAHRSLKLFKPHFKIGGASRHRANGLNVKIRDRIPQRAGHFSSCF